MASRTEQAPLRKASSGDLPNARSASGDGLPAASPALSMKTALKAAPAMKTAMKAIPFGMARGLPSAMKAAAMKAVAKKAPKKAVAMKAVAMKAVAKKALKKAAIPFGMARGLPTPAGGAKAKAIAAKSFAAVAAKAKKSASSEALPGAGKWYFMSDLRKTKEGAYDEKAWKPYDAKMQKALEMAFTKGFKQYTCQAPGGNEYIVKFKTMMQFRKDDKFLQRPVKRE